MLHVVPQEFDLPISAISVVCAVLSFATAVRVWAVRNGGIFTRVLCVKLLCVGAFAAMVAVEALFAWADPARRTPDFYALLFSSQIVIMPQYLVVAVIGTAHKKKLH